MSMEHRGRMLEQVASWRLAMGQMVVIPMDMQMNLLLVSFVPKDVDLT